MSEDAAHTLSGAKSVVAAKACAARDLAPGWRSCNRYRKKDSACRNRTLSPLILTESAWSSEKVCCNRDCACSKVWSSLRISAEGAQAQSSSDAETVAWKKRFKITSIVESVPYNKFI